MRLFHLASDFEKENPELTKSDGGFEFLGLKHMAQFYMRAVVSSSTSLIEFSEEQDDEDLLDYPDFVLSENLFKDLKTVVSSCALMLTETKYLPKSVKVGDELAMFLVGARNGKYLEAWEDFEIIGCDGVPIYTEVMLTDAGQTEQKKLAIAFRLIVKDICDDGRMGSPDWYRARILYEFFRENPVPPENAFLIGQLFKELSFRQAYEDELSTYHKSLTEDQKRRQKGAFATREKAQEQRDFCVGLFVDLVQEVGPRLAFASAEVQAHELRKIALNARPDSFTRSGKPYSDAWFLRNIIEDRKLEIIEALEKAQTTK